MGEASTTDPGAAEPAVSEPNETQEPERLPTGINIVVKENQRGVSYENLFGDYLKGVTEIHIVDPYIRLFYQVKNLHELCRLVYRQKEPGDEVCIKVITTAKPEDHAEVEKLLCQLESSLFASGIDLSFDIEPDRAQHDRYIETDTGYKIILGRGLDIFQPYDLNDAFALANTVQEERGCKGFEVTIVG